jgi:hypothetical protein
MPSTQSASIAEVIGWEWHEEINYADGEMVGFWHPPGDVWGRVGPLPLEPTADDLLAWLRRRVSMFDPIEIVAFGKLVRVSLRDGRRHQLVADGATVLEALEAAVRGVQSRLAP